MSLLRSLLLAATLLCPAGLAVTQTTAAAPAVVYVVPIEGVIDLGLAPFVARVLAEAEKAGAAAVILEVNTFGGRVDAAVQIRDSLLTARVPTVALVNKRAISAGALISLAAEKLAMADGGTIGAATPVQAGAPGGGTQPTSEKTVSYVRKEFRATAESRKRPPAIAEAMVDPDVAISGVVEKGKLLTLTTEEALQQKLADFRADSIDAVLAHLKLAGAELRPARPNWAERLVRFLTHPILSSLLITLAMIGIIVELRTPGFGVPGIVGLGSLALFFWGHWLVQLAGWEELLLAAAGVALLVFELFVTPGFGIAGALGIVALVAALVMSLGGGGATAAFWLTAAARVVFALLFAVVGALLLLRFMPRTPVGRALVLEDTLSSARGYTAAPEEEHRLVGRTGRTTSPLHPSGFAEIDGERVDVVAEGEHIDPGEPVRVVRVDGNRVVVRRVAQPNTKE